MQEYSQASETELPRPDAAALAHSELLQQLIRLEIDNNDGFISFARFMQMALFEPGLGYYSAGASKIGASGDFTTAPEISPLFSICLARQCAEVMQELQNPVILELGAGTGVMASDMLREWQKSANLPEQYFILETSADLRARQKHLLGEKVPDLMSRIVWLDSLPQSAFEGIILANEVLDAMPVQRFRLQQGQVTELGIENTGNAFTWSSRVADARLELKLKKILRQSLSALADGYTSEINTGLETWIQALADTLKKGAMFLVDYGYSRHEYYHEQRQQGTLLCHYRHRVHDDPLVYIGLQDITASVDFTAVAEAGVSAGLQVSGYTTQAFFLLACGLEQLMQEQLDNDERQRLEFGQQVKLLTLPGEMGERFKVIALSRGLATALTGFSIVDHRRRL